MLYKKKTELFYKRKEKYFTCFRFGSNSNSLNNALFLIITINVVEK
jgi:hypothetical protein